MGKNVNWGRLHSVRSEMFIGSSMTSPMAPFEGAEDNEFVNHSRIPPLLRTEPEGALRYVL